MYLPWSVSCVEASWWGICCYAISLQQPCVPPPPVPLIFLPTPPLRPFSVVCLLTGYWYLEEEKVLWHVRGVESSTKGIVLG